MSLESAHHSCLVEWHVYTSYFVPCTSFIYNCKIINLCSYVEKRAFSLDSVIFLTLHVSVLLVLSWHHSRKVNSLSEYEDRNLCVLSWRRCKGHFNFPFQFLVSDRLHNGFTPVFWIVCPS